MLLGGPRLRKYAIQSVPSNRLLTRSGRRIKMDCEPKPLSRLYSRTIYRTGSTVFSCSSLSLFVATAAFLDVAVVVVISGPG